jgi:hypothetical protein
MEQRIINAILLKVSNRSNTTARRRFIVGVFLALAVSLIVLPALFALAGAQDKAASDETVYKPGFSAEDRFKISEKQAIESKTGGNSSLAPPANDNFADASGFIGSGGSGFTLATNVDATGEVGEPIHGAGGGGIGGNQNSVWYRFTAPSTRVITISTSSGGTDPIVDTVLSAYTGSSLGNLTPIAENDDYPGLSFYSKITFSVVAGQTYHIAVDGYSYATGTFYISYTYSSSAANDNFSSAETFSATSSPYIGITGSNVGATAEGGEPNHANNSGTLNSIWYSWTAPASLSMTFTTAGSTFDTTLSVYTGASVSALTLVAFDDDDGPGNSSRVTFIAQPGVTYRIAIEGFSSQTGNTLLNWNINRAESGKQFDFDSDLKSDFAVFRPGNNVWYILNSSNNSYQFIQWGLAGDVLVPGIDYEGDDKADAAVWRPSDTVFYARRSSNGLLLATQWGLSGDIPVQGDFDGDDKSDVAVWRPSTGTFYVWQSSFQTMLALQWGLNGDKPATGDYDGDGRTDFAVWRPSNGVFYIFRSSNNTYQFTQWGLNGDLVVPGDYDRDGKNDIAVYRPSTNVFYVRRSSDNALAALQWGIGGDLPAPGDYDGNGYTDFCVWRPSTGVFYVFRNPSGGYQFVQWGQNGDVPVANSNVH